MKALGAKASSVFFVSEGMDGMPRKLNVYGLSRVSQEGSVLQMSLNRKPTDEELRAIHEILRKAINYGKGEHFSQENKKKTR